MKYLCRGSLLIMAMFLIPGFFTILMNGLSGERDKEPQVCVITKDGKEVDGTDYIIGMAATQADYIQEKEAWKAWLIVCRTNFLKAAGKKKKVREEALNLDYISKEELEKNNGKKAYASLMNVLQKARQDTAGQVLFYDNQMIHALYHEISPGRTLSSKEVYGKKCAYLTSVDSSQDVEAKNYIVTRVIGYKECARKLSDRERNVTEDMCRQSLKITKQTKHGYVREVSIKGARWTGEQWRKKFELPSCYFYIEEYKGKLRMVTLGKGTGVGMSLYGANAMAKKGMPYKMILSYYYPGTEMKNMVVTEK